jgi:hypothetical protein
MLKKYCFLLLLLLPAVQTAVAQIPLTGNRLACEGIMPQRLEQKLSDKKNHPLKSLYHAGLIVYGSKVNRYLDTILDRLLAKEPALRNELTVLVTLFPKVNAYADSEGFLFVNVGLIAQTSSEAEIAFVLSHEIAHYVLRHKVPSKQDARQNVYIEHHRHSREEETEADRTGMERFFAASPYSFSAIDGTFDVMQYAHLPFDNLPFDRSYVEADCYRFPERSFPKNIRPVNTREDYLDTLSTHPNTAKRRQYMQRMAENRSDEGRMRFVQDWALFEEIRHLCRMECLHLWLLRHQFASAYYNAYLLEKLAYQPEIYRQRLHNIMAVALYGIAKHKYDGLNSEIVPRNEETEGEAYAFVYFVRHITQHEMAVLALRKLWQIRQQQPDNKDLDNICKDLTREIIAKSGWTIDRFSDYPMGANIDSAVNADTATLPSASNPPVATGKYGNIKQTTAMGSKVKPSSDFQTVHYMLADLKQDSAFMVFFRQREHEVEDDAVLRRLEPSFPKLADVSLAIEPPICLYRRRLDYDLRRSDALRKRLQTMIASTVKKWDLSHVFVGKTGTTLLSSEQYNAQIRYKQWLNYVIYGMDAGVLPYYMPDWDMIAPEAGYLLLTKVYMRTRARFNYIKIQNAALSVLCLPVLPFTLAQLVLERKDASVFFVLINLQDGKAEAIERFAIDRSHCTESHVHAFVYDCLYQMKKGGKR